MMEEFGDGEGFQAEDLVECWTCKRRFLPKVLDKHAKICQKSAAQKRRVFDSSRQRAEGTDISTLKPIKPKSQRSSSSVNAAPLTEVDRDDVVSQSIDDLKLTSDVYPEPPKKPSNWRKKHEDFIATIRAAKAVTQVMKEGGPLPPPPPPTYDPDYIQCPYCQRRFNENAADRHIKFCKEQAARLPRKKVPDVRKTPGGRSQPLSKPFAASPVSAAAAAAAAAKRTIPPAVSTIPSASSRLPQRSSYGLSPGAPSSKTSSAGSLRTSPCGLTSPPSGVGKMTYPGCSGNGSVRHTSYGLNRKKIDSYKTRNEFDGQHDNGIMQRKFCHACGTKYPIESAKFCCECGVRRMII